MVQECSSHRISSVGMSPPSVSPSALVLLCWLSFSLPYTEDSPVLICCFLGLGDSTQREWLWFDRAGEEAGKRKENTAYKKQQSIKMLKQCQSVSK